MTKYGRLIAATLVGGLCVCVWLWNRIRLEDGTSEVLCKAIRYELGRASYLCESLK